MGDLAGSVYGDVDPAVFEQADVSAVELAGSAKLSGENPFAARTRRPAPQAFLILLLPIAPVRWLAICCINIKRSCGDAARQWFLGFIRV